MKVSGKINLRGLKRCKVDIQIKIKCPECGKPLVCDLMDRSLSYPVVGHNESVGFYCGLCDLESMDLNIDQSFEWTLPIKILSADMVIEYNLSKLK